MRWIGLGDIIAAISPKFGLLPSADCGCKQRQARLNRWFPRVGVTWQ